MKTIVENSTVSFLDQNRIYDLTTSNLPLESFNKFTAKDFSLIHIKEITFEEKAPRKEAFENVIDSIRTDGVNFLYLIIGDSKGVNFYFGAVKDIHKNIELDMPVQDVGNIILEPNILANFRGSKVEYLNVSKRTNVHEQLKSMESLAYLEGLPTLNEDNEDLQGIDRLINVMKGDAFALSIVASPLDTDEINDIQQTLWQLHNSLSAVYKIGHQKTSGYSASSNMSEGTNNSDTNTIAKNESTTTTKNKGVSSSRNISATHSVNKSTNTGSGSSKTSSINDSVSTGKNSSSSQSTNESSSHGTNKSDSKSKNQSVSSGTTSNVNKGSSSTQGTTQGQSSSDTSGSNSTRGTNDTDSSSSDKTTGSSSNSQKRGTNKSHAYTTSKGTSDSHADTVNSGTNNSRTNNSGSSKGTSNNQTSGTSNNSSVGTTDNRTSGNSHSNTQGDSKNVTQGKSKSKTSNESLNVSQGTSDNKTHGDSKTSNKGTSVSEASTDSTSNSNSTGISTNQGSTFSKQGGNNTTYEETNKKAQEFMSYIDEILLKRVNYGRNRGLFNINVSLFAENEVILRKLGNTMRSLSSGNAENKAPLSLSIIEKDSIYSDYACSFQIPICTPNNTDSQITKLFRVFASQYINNSNVSTMSSWGSLGELSIIAGLPQKEVVGLSLTEEVEFGLNSDINTNNSDMNTEIKGHTIALGSLVQSGNITNYPIELSEDDMNKHTFIAGTTGSGKTTTCRKILLESNSNFLIIEPAKTEYRVLKTIIDDLIIFTLGDDDVAPFRLNPLEFSRYEKITSRVDVLKASIESAFDMEAAIPQLIEATIYQCYEDKGWNINTNKNDQYDDPFADGVYSFPTLQDVVDTVDAVATAQGFDEKLKKDYIGSINARLQSLLKGSKGAMLNTKRSVDFNELVNKKVVIELEQIRNGGEKSLIMGFVMANLNQAIIENYELNPKGFKHITLVEEAHRLLSKYQQGDAPSKRQGVEVFADMLAEVRKYGESLIIVDQIPNKLTPEVLKNTNTKIIHKIFAQDDKDAVGNTMALKDEQKDFLSILPAGRAIIMTPNFTKPQQVQIEKVKNLDDKAIIEKNILREDIFKYYLNNREKRIIPGLYHMPKDITIEDVKYIFNLSFNKKFLYALHILDQDVANINKFVDTIKPIYEEKGEDFVFKYLLDVSYQSTVEDKTRETLKDFIHELLCNYKIYTKKEYKDIKDCIINNLSK